MYTGDTFLNRIPMVYALRSRIDKVDLIKLQSFCKAKDTRKIPNLKKRIKKRQKGHQQIGKESLPILNHIGD